MMGGVVLVYVEIIFYFLFYSGDMTLKSNRCEHRTYAADYAVHARGARRV